VTGNNSQSLGALWIAVASVLVGLVSWMDMLMMTVVCHRAAGWAQLITLRLSLLNATAGARPGTARQGQNNRKLHKDLPQKIDSSYLPLHYSTLTHLVN